jgi:hypothetical protein
MKNLSEKIMDMVKEYNEKGEEVYLKMLILLLIKNASVPTIQKTVRQLVDDKELIERIVTVGRGTFKYLYVSNYVDKKNADNTIHEMNKKIDMLVVKMDALSRSLSGSK